MDKRKGQIEELEQQKREKTVSLDILLTRLGETLLGRLGEGASPENDVVFEDAAEYRRLKQEIAGSEAAIQTVEEQLHRFRKLEEEIELKEQENGSRSKELAGHFGRLGRLLLDKPEAGDFAVPWREQADVLLAKVRSLEDRLSGLEQREGNNVFSWIGKSAQSLVLRSFLTKAQDNLEQLYRSIGERYGRRENLAESTEGTLSEGESGTEIKEIYAEIEEARSLSRALSEELMALGEEKRKISAEFSAEGGPLKQIQVLKNHIAGVKDQLKAMYRRVGSEAVAIASSSDGEDGEGRIRFIKALIGPDDGETLNSAGQISLAIRDADAAIAKLRASLAIDDEKAKIERFRRQIEDKKARIAEAEKEIAEFEESIKDSEKYIEGLQKLL
jgi:septal ring factor EnvC (AmiA/AmiB activator)